MDAKITQIQKKSAKFDSDGLLVNHAYASLTLNIPLDTQEARDKVNELTDLLNSEWVLISVEARQPKIPIEEE